MHWNSYKRLSIIRNKCLAHNSLIPNKFSKIFNKKCYKCKMHNNFDNIISKIKVNYYYISYFKSFKKLISFKNKHLITN